MPVNILLCEGSSGSPDVRVLSKLLSGLCEIKPLGGKYGMGDSIIARREIQSKDINGKDIVFGLLDRDFIEEWHVPNKQPCIWKSKDSQITFGWRWERKEIENYLIDPDVVKKALNQDSFDLRGYCETLEKARDAIAIYQASRIALSVSRVRFKPLTSSFGPIRGKEKYPFPDSLDEQSCREGIKRTIQNHQQTQTISEKGVMQAFERYKSECNSGGDRY